jgi:hypothetical protein
VKELSPDKKRMWHVVTDVSVRKGTGLKARNIDVGNDVVGLTMI